ncbi:MAG: creatininase family protein [Prolixibacteraceae bacterium]|nr:creatininase family protein [Prolixibacteraceae bacterium]
MKPYILEETNWSAVKGSNFDIAVLPWGATEPHNLHLPYGTDSLETKEIVKEVVEKAWEEGCKVMMLPTIPFGVQNPGQIELPFCLHVKPSTQLQILKDITSALYGQGIRKLVIFNGHGGNDFKSLIREIQPDFKDMFIGLSEWFRIFKNEDFFEENGDHAGEMETSIMQYYFPELVLPLEQAGEGKMKKFKIEALNLKTAWAPRRWDKVSTDTGIGNPKKANPEKGRKFLDAVIQEMADFLVDLGKYDPEEIYEQ